jgi:hypothetical protein
LLPQGRAWFLCDQLAAYLAGRPHSPDDLVFTAPQGSPLLGHASATVTLDRYGHLFPDQLQRLAERLQEAYAEAVTDPAVRDDASRTQRSRSVTCS